MTARIDLTPPTLLAEVDFAIDVGGIVAGRCARRDVGLVSDLGEVEGMANGLEPLPGSDRIVRDDGRSVDVFRCRGRGRAA